MSELLTLVLGLVLGGLVGWLYGFRRGVFAIAARMGWDDAETLRRLRDLSR